MSEYDQVLHEDETTVSAYIKITCIDVVVTFDVIILKEISVTAMFNAASAFSMNHCGQNFQFLFHWLLFSRIFGWN